MNSQVVLGEKPDAVNPHAALSIVVPVLNEAEAFPQLWEALNSSIHSDFRVFVVYDFEHDTTLPVVKQIVSRGERRLHLAKNRSHGVVGAILTGFEQAPDGPVLVVMGDLSDDLSKVDRMLELYRQGYQLVVGSRYMKGGGIENGRFPKQTLSRLAGLLLYWLRGLPTHDATNAYKLYDRSMLRALPIKSRGGFELSLEITVKAFLSGYRIAEIPTVWRERTTGTSHFKLWKWLPHYLKWFLYAFRPRRSAQQSSETAGLYNA